MRSVKVNNSSFDLAINFKHTQELRASFNRLTEAIYGFSFEDWYQLGYWGDRYIPYSLLDGQRVVSNVSVNVIEFVIAGEKKTGVQIGTVMTDTKYRNLGLNKFIMKQVLDEWKTKSDFIYLFANDRVLDLYPMFGFKVVDEYQHSSLITANFIDSKVKKLNMDDEKDRAFLVDTINKSVPVSKLSMRDNASLQLFYCTSILKNHVYYVDAYKSVVIAEFKGDTLYLHDVFTTVSSGLNNIIAAMAKKNTKKVVFGFTPLDATDYECTLLKEEDTTLFILKDQLDFFRDKKWMFPVLSHA